MRLVLPALVLLALACAGPVDPAGNPAQDVRGDYDLSYADTLTLRLDVGGATWEAQADGWTDEVTFEDVQGEPLVLDLGAFCADPAVVCPDEAFPARVSVDQLDVERVQDLHALRIYDRDGVPSADTADTALVHPSLEGVVDHAQGDTFLVGLQGQGDQAGDCATLGVSYAGGRFARADAADPETGVAPVVGIVEGEVVGGWLALCAWDGLAVGATLTATVAFTGARIGDASLP